MAKPTSPPSIKKTDDEYLQDTIEMTKKGLQQTFGDSGTQRYSGYFTEEFNAKWRDANRVTVVEEMRRSDGPVKAILTAMKSPILATEWEIEGGEENIREFVEENIFGLKRTWRRFLKEALGFLDFGHYVFEVLWEVRDGKIYLKDLAPRIPRSIQAWQMSNGHRGIRQQISTDEFPETIVDIPWDKLLILTNDMEGDDVTGQSVLRPAYKHYFLKDVLYRVQSIAAERYGAGIPVLYLPPDIGADQKSKMEQALKHMKTNEQGYLIIPWKKEDGELNILTPDGNPQGASIESAIDHHNKMILMSILAAFLGLGTDTSGTGSFALSKDQSSFFLKHVEDKATYLADEITNQVIKKLVYLNFGEVQECPRLKFAPLGDIDFNEYSQSLERLVNSGVVTANAKLEQFMRKQYKMPEMNEDEYSQREEDDEKKRQVKEQQTVLEKDQNSKKKDSDEDLADKRGAFWRNLTEVEKKTNFKFLAGQFDEQEDQLRRELEAMTAEAILFYIATIQKKLEQEDIVSIGDLALPAAFILAFRKQVKDALARSYEIGKKGAADELKLPGATPTSAATRKLRNVEADQITEAFKGELERSSKNIVISAKNAGADNAAIIAATRDEMLDKSSQMITNITGTVVGQGVNRGRQDVYYDNITQITKFQRSEILDGRTCNVCLSLDKRVVPAGDPMVALDSVHTNCRGLWVPIFVYEEQPSLRPIPKTVTDTFDTIDGRPIINRFKQIKKPINKANEDAKKEIERRIKEKMEKQK